MLSRHHLAVALAASFVIGSGVQAEAGFGGWGVAVYEKPAPTPAAQPAPSAPPAPAVVASGKKKTVKLSRHAGHERVAAVHKPDAPAPAPAQDTSPAPTPAKVATAEPKDTAGPVEAAAPTIQDLITKHARANGVPEKLAAAVVSIESRFNPKARGGSALGLMQIKYNTARSIGYAGGIPALLTPDTNLQFGMKVLADAYKASNGDVCMTLARYQSGHRVTHASAANRAYCARARSYMAKAS